MDFKPLYHCIHIYTALDSLDELRKSYQADRRVRRITFWMLHRFLSTLQAQSDLILPTPIPLNGLTSLIQEVAGFFIVETHVLNTTGNFRSEQELEELWDSLLGRLCLALDDALSAETDPEGYLRVKEALIGFIMTMEVRTLSTIPFRPCSPVPCRHTSTRRRGYILSSSSCSKNIPIFSRSNLVNGSKM